MTKNLTAEGRLLLAASVVAAIAYYAFRQSELALPIEIALKGAGVALLAAYAWLRSARLIAVVLVLGALGDMLIELKLEWGAMAFLVGHLVAIFLYLCHRRDKLGISQKAAAISLAILTPVIAVSLLADPTQRAGVGVYSLALGTMAASAWISSFPRYRTGLGAVLFVASDLLIFARLGPLSASILPSLLIWPLYFAGQFLICIGVVGSAVVQPEHAPAR